MTMATNNPPRTTQSAVNDILFHLENVIAADSQAVLGDLDLLAKVNGAARERYKSMTEAAVGLENDGTYLKQKYAELIKYTKQVDEIDERVGDLELLVKELDEWCSELEIKVRRLASSKKR